MTDRVIPQCRLMDPDRLQVTVQDDIVTLPGRPENDQSAETSSRPAGTSRALSPSWTSWALRTTIYTRPHPDNACFTSLWSVPEEHAGMVDLGADGDPDQSLSHQQRGGARRCASKAASRGDRYLQ